MPKTKSNPSAESIRHSEYYGMEEEFDKIYADAKAGKPLESCMDQILSTQNILLAYRNIKRNTGSNTAGTDDLTIKEIETMSASEVVEKVRYIVRGTPHGYRPKPVRRKEIPKPDGTTRPLGIPCIWDRLVQQCIKQVLEPYCEAKFEKDSFGFRPGRSVENAISRTYNLMQLSNLHYVVELDIKGFFDNIDHTVLIRKMWSLGIRDKELIFVVKRILKAPIKMPDGKMVSPGKGTLQGIISPLLANIYLDELDKWILSQWQNHPIAEAHKHMNGNHWNKGNGYEIMKKTHLKEMRIVRYADDARIFCRNREDAENTLKTVRMWLQERLRLEKKKKKTRVVNCRKQYMEFLGFKIRLEWKRNKYLIVSHMSDKAYNRELQGLKDQIKAVAKSGNGYNEVDAVVLYDLRVMGIHNYYQIATCINLDCMKMQRSVDAVWTARFKGRKRLTKEGKRALTDVEAKRYGKSKMLRYLTGNDKPIYPIGYVNFKNPKGFPTGRTDYSPEGRLKYHTNLELPNVWLMRRMALEPGYGRSIELMDNRLSLFAAQQGKCAVTGRLFLNTAEIHCHHKVMKSKVTNGTADRYENLVLVLEDVHRLIHATDEETIQKYLGKLNLDQEQLQKLNKLREIAGNNEIQSSKIR